MQYCENCRQLFFERESGGCPWCGLADDVFPAAECRGCGGFFAPDDVFGGLCPDCRIKVHKACTAFWDSLSPAAQDYVLDVGYHPAG